MFAKIVLGTCGLALLLAAGAWVSTRFLMTPEVTSPGRKVPSQGTSFFEFSISAKAGYIRVDGTANLPNGVILIGALDKVGSGQVEVKEALVMNRLFALEFGPDLYLQYYLQNPQPALQAGVFRLSVEFDPGQQSPFAQESLLRWSQTPFSLGVDRTGENPDLAVVRISKILTIGTLDEQRAVQAREQEYRQMVRQHLNETLASLTNLVYRLQVHYQEERRKGSFARVDQRGEEWRIWSIQWLNDLNSMAEKSRLNDVASPVSPLLSARDALATLQRQLLALQDLYLEVLTNERPDSDRDLQRTERAIQQAIANAGSQLGHPSVRSPEVKAEDVKPTVIITAAVVNVRNRPGMGYEAISQAKKDEVFELIGEQGEWLHVQLTNGRTGWVHRNIASKQAQSEAIVEETKRSDISSIAHERKPLLHVEPVNILATPVAYIPRPTSDERRIYGDIEAQLRDLKERGGDERKSVEQRVIHRASEIFSISPEQIWNAYLKVQGWELAQ